jgi:hypothetical protein
MFIRADILELYGSSLHHVTDVMVSDLYVFRLVMKYMIICHLQLWISHRIVVASISRSNRPVNNLRSHMASQLAEHATLYYASTVLRGMLDCFLLCHEIMVDPNLKQHPEVLFLLETLPTQSESVYSLNVKL